MSILEFIGAIALYCLAVWAGAALIAWVALRWTKDGGLASLAVANFFVIAWLSLTAIVGLLGLGFYIGKAFS